MTTMEDVLAAHWTFTTHGDFDALVDRCAGCHADIFTHGHGLGQQEAWATHQAQALESAGYGRLPDDATLSRVEVIDNSGRALVKYTPAGTITVDRQDGGRTLKVFITEGATK
jgi:hypothetical protein